MPKVSYLRTKNNRIAEASKCCVDIARIIKGYANAPQIGKNEMCDISESTALRRLAAPAELTLQELIQICVAFDIPREDVVAKLKW